MNEYDEGIDVDELGEDPMAPMRGLWRGVAGGLITWTLVALIIFLVVRG